MFVGHDFVVTVRHGRGVAAARRPAQFLESAEHVLTHGPSAVVYAVCDTVVDAYLEVVDDLQEDVDEVEESVFSTDRTNDSARIYTLKREIAEVRRAVLPLREPMRRFASGLVPGVDAEAAPFFRDVVDHLTQAAEVVDTLDTLLSTAFDAHLAAISVQQNDDMRKISAGAALVVVPDPDRRRLRHELRPHARAALAARLPVRAAADGRRRPACCSGSSSAPAGCRPGPRRRRSGVRARRRRAAPSVADAERDPVEHERRVGAGSRRSAAARRWRRTRRRRRRRWPRPSGPSRSGCRRRGSSLQLEEPGADDGRDGEQEGVAGGGLAVVAERTAHRQGRAGAGDAGHQRERLGAAPIRTASRRVICLISLSVRPNRSATPSTTPITISSRRR